ncbi:MAG TPA: hypothetical protein VJ063_16550 [Verrucomicrobiae bacterium]|nr:hypothetical protein [Verrucomicrobiae bacterium]
MSRWILTIAAALLVCGARAEEAVVETRDGRAVEGVISLQENVLSVVSAERGSWVDLAVTNLSSALFKSRPPDPYLPHLYAAQAENEAELWAGKDIGWLLAPGTDSSFLGLHRTFCTGTNIAGVADSFRFTHQPIVGNREIVARIIRIPRGQNAKAGLMLRESLKPDAAHFFIGVNAGGGGMFQYREQSGGETMDFQRPDLFAPQWLKLKRAGNRISAFKSGNGRKWTLIQEMDVQFPDEVLAGVAVTGISAGPLGERQFSMCDNLQIGYSLPQNPYRPVVHLQSGSTVVGRVRGATESEVQFMGPLPKSPLARSAISRIDFQWVPYRYSSFLNEVRPGILLTSGDYIEGEFKGVQENSAVISSVLAGIRSFDLNQDVLCIVLHRPTEQKPYAFQVSTIDGSRWLATDLQFGRNEIIVRDAALGVARLPIYELAEIRRFPFQRSAPAFAQAR